ncbi:MAG: O-antigen ligase family protein [Pseudomonadota bacterium]
MQANSEQAQTGQGGVSWIPVSAQNVWFAVLAVSAVTVVGSGLTVAVICASVWGAFALARGVYRFHIAGHQVPFVIATVTFALVGFSMTRFHAGTPIGLDGFEYLIFLAPLFLLPRYAVGPSKEKLRQLFKVALAAAGIVAGVVAVFQLLYWDMRAEGAAGNALAFATVAAMFGPASLLLLIESERPSDKLLGILGWSGAVIAVILSQSRTMIVVVLACSVLVAAFNWRALTRDISVVLMRLLVGLTLAVTALSVVVVLDRTNTDVQAGKADETVPSSAGWRGVYLEAGWRVASNNWLLGVGRFERAHRVGLELESKEVPTKLQTKTEYTSWHRVLPQSVRPAVVKWQVERWERAREKEIAIEGVGDQSQSPLPRPFIEATTIERVVSPHSHLHNAYMTMFVDHGVIGLLSLLMLFFAPVLGAVNHGLHRTDPSLLSCYVATVLGLSFAGLTNVHIENDVIASYFVVLSVIYWCILRTSSDQIS